MESARHGRGHRFEIGWAYRLKGSIPLLSSTHLEYALEGHESESRLAKGAPQARQVLP